jgi:DNA end-binding protein Ku
VSSYLEDRRRSRDDAEDTTMPPHAIGSGTISFGLVSIPIKLYAATSPGSVSFNLLHAKCGSRIRQQQFCPQCNVVVDRSELVRAYEFAKEQYVRVSDDELKSLEGEASKAIDIAEFVPLDRVDPIFFERTYYLGPDKGGEKPYRLLAEAMARSEQVAVARFVMRGKENIVLVRAAQGGLMLHTMYFADEVRNFGEIDKGQSAVIKDNEIDLALQLINGLARGEFKPETYRDEYRQRVLELVESKVAGKEITTTPAAAPRSSQVIDLAEALRQSLAKRGAADKKPLAKAKSASPPRRAEAAPRKAQAGRK